MCGTNQSYKKVLSYIYIKIQVQTADVTVRFIVGLFIRGIDSHNIEL